MVQDKIQNEKDLIKRRAEDFEKADAESQDLIRKLKNEIQKEKLERESVSNQIIAA